MLGVVANMGGLQSTESYDGNRGSCRYIYLVGHNGACLEGIRQQSGRHWKSDKSEGGSVTEQRELREEQHVYWSP